MWRRLSRIVGVACAFGLVGLAHGCVKADEGKEEATDHTVRHYRLMDRAVDPVAGQPEYLEVSLANQAMDTRILRPPPEGEVRALFVSIPSSMESPARHFCRLTYGSPDPSGTVGDAFPVDQSLAPRLGLPDGFNCRKGRDFEDRRMVQYYCEDPRARAVGGLLETRCHFENSRPTAVCLLSVRVPSRAYFDCEYSPRDVGNIRAMAEDISSHSESFIRRP